MLEIGIINKNNISKLADILEKAGITVVQNPAKMGVGMAELMKSRKVTEGNTVA